MTKETKELVEWAKSYLTRMTINELRVNKSIFIFDLKKNLEMYVRCIPLHDGNPTFTSEITQLQEIKDKIEELEKEGTI